MNNEQSFALNKIESQSRPLDTGVVTGAIAGAFLILVTIIASGKALSFINPLGLIMVLGGTFAATMIQFSISEMHQAWLGFRSILYAREEAILERILYFVDLSKKIRREGLLVLDIEATKTKDLYLAKALEITVDGTDPDTIRRVLETEIRTSIEQQLRAVSVFQTMATYAPAFGLIGTIIGLVGLLGSLNSPEAVGPAMSIALMTTLYGALLANLIFLPVAGKLKMRSEEDALISSITIEGVLCIARQDNPIVIEQKLQSFLPSIHTY